jgi:hypothetical protein
MRCLPWTGRPAAGSAHLQPGHELPECAAIRSVMRRVTRAETQRQSFANEMDSYAQRGAVSVGFVREQLRGLLSEDEINALLAPHIVDSAST